MSGGKYQNFERKLEKLDPEAEIEIGCQSYCGPGRRKRLPSSIIDHLLRLLRDELLEKVTAQLKTKRSGRRRTIKKRNEERKRRKKNKIEAKEIKLNVRREKIGIKLYYKLKL